MQSSSRGGVKVRNLAVHTTEGIMRATDLRAYFNRVGTASSHASCDETGVLLDGAADGFVAHDRAAWTIRNGNAYTENLEVCGRAGWSRQDWLSRPRILEAVAVWLARRSGARGIPLSRLTVPQLRAQWVGVIDHDDYSKATGDGTHWDVGDGFPFDVVIPRALAIAGGVPVPPPTPRKRKRTMYLTSDLSQTVYVVDDSLELRVLYTGEEVNCVAWLTNTDRAADAILHHNNRFHDVLLNIGSRDPIRQRPQLPAPVRSLTAAPGVTSADLFAATGYATPDEPWGPPAPVDDPDAVGPPPGFVGFDVFAPGHD